MKINPVKMVGFFEALLSGILVLHLFLLYLDEAGNESRFDMVFPMTLSLVYIVSTLSFIHFAFEHMQKRIDALEEKLNSQNQSSNT